MKIVINRCYGGYSLSEKVLEKYIERKGLKLFKGAHICVKSLKLYSFKVLIV